MEQTRNVKLEGLEHSRPPREEGKGMWHQDQFQQPPQQHRQAQAHPMRQAVHNGFPMSAMNPMMAVPSFYGQPTGVSTTPHTMTPRLLGNPYAAMSSFASGHRPMMPPAAPPSAFPQQVTPGMFQSPAPPFNHPLHNANFQPHLAALSQQPEQLMGPQQHALSREQPTALAPRQHSSHNEESQGHTQAKPPAQEHSHPAASSTKQDRSARPKAHRKRQSNLDLPRATLDLKVHLLVLPSSWLSPAQAKQGQKLKGGVQEERSASTQGTAQDEKRDTLAESAESAESFRQDEASPAAQRSGRNAADESEFENEQEVEDSTQKLTVEQEMNYERQPAATAAPTTAGTDEDDSYGFHNSDGTHESEDAATSGHEQPAKRRKETINPNPAFAASATSGTTKDTGKQEHPEDTCKGVRMLDRRLQMACRLNSIQLALRCLQQGANPHARDEKGVSPLALAASCGHEVLLEVLLNAVDDVNVETPHIRTALHHAMVRGHQSIVNQLVYHGADVEASDIRGITPRMLATRNKLDIPDSSEGRSSSLFFINQHVAVLLDDTWSHAQITELDEDDEGGVDYHVTLARSNEEHVVPEQQLQRLTLEIANKTKALEAVSLGGSGLRQVSQLPDNLPNRPCVFVVNDKPTTCFGTAHLDLTWALITVITQDHEEIRAGNTSRLPATPTVKSLLGDWAKEYGPLSSTLETQAAALQELFRALLPVRLLYEQEHGQYKELTEANPNGFDVCDVYGARHFLRLFMLMPEMMYTTSTHTGQIQDLLNCVRSMLAFLDARAMSFLAE